MKNTIILFTIILLFLTVNSCNKYELDGMYDIINIEYNITEQRVEQCFKSSFIIFDLNTESVEFPGFNEVSLKGKYSYKNDSLHIQGLPECYFNGTYKVFFATDEINDFIKLENSNYKIICSRIDYTKGQFINHSVLERALDEESLNSTECMDFKHRKCLD